MKVAIVHDWISTVGGGEKVVLTLAQAMGADLVTGELDPSIPRAAGFEGVRVRSLGSLPRAHPWRAIAASRRFSRLIVDADVVVLSGNWAVHAARRNHPNIDYCYTPTRVFYELRGMWLAGLPAAQRPFARAWSSMHRGWNERALAHVDRIIAISENVRARVRRYWGRDSAVVYPPVPTDRYRFDGVGDFWLSVSRLSHEKRLDLAVEAFRSLPHERLIVVGGAPPGTNRRAFIGRLRPPANVEFRGVIPEREIVDLYSRCRGVVSTAADEDFGLTAVEANASGKVIVAADGGGFRESQIDGVTGFLLPSRPGAFADRIRSLTTADLEGRAHACREQARKFDARVFIEAMRAELESAAEGGVLLDRP